MIKCYFCDKAIFQGESVIMFTRYKSIIEQRGPDQAPDYTCIRILEQQIACQACGEKKTFNKNIFFS